MFFFASLFPSDFFYVFVCVYVHKTQNSMNTIRSYCYYAILCKAKPQKMAKVKKKNERETKSRQREKKISEKVKIVKRRRRRRRKRTEDTNRFSQWVEFLLVYNFSIVIARTVSYNLFSFNPFGKNV